MTYEEINKLPTLQKVVEQVLQEESQILSQERLPLIVIESSPSAIHKPKSVIRISLCRTTQRNPNDRFGIKDILIGNKLQKKILTK